MLRSENSLVMLNRHAMLLSLEDFNDFMVSRGGQFALELRLSEVHARGTAKQHKSHHMSRDAK
jgi:hypothetical protein